MAVSILPEFWISSLRSLLLFLEVTVVLNNARGGTLNGDLVVFDHSLVPPLIAVGLLSLLRLTQISLLVIDSVFIKSRLLDILLILLVNRKSDGSPMRQSRRQHHSSVKWILGTDLRLVAPSTALINETLHILVVVEEDLAVVGQFVLVSLPTVDHLIFEGVTQLLEALPIEMSGLLEAILQLVGVW